MSSIRDCSRRHCRKLSMQQHLLVLSVKARMPPAPMDRVGRLALDTKHVRVVGLVAVLCLSSVMPVFSRDGGIGLRDVSLRPELRDIRLVPVIGALGPKKTLALWQLPEGPVRKLLVIFKPKDILPYVFWDYSPSCRLCTGGPEKRKFVIDALHKNYAVLVPESLVFEDVDHNYSDWGSWPEDNLDVLNAVDMIADWKSLHGLENVPVVTVGSSAGGFIVSTLALRPGFFESMAIMVCYGQLEAFELATHEYPPVIFVHMPKDTGTALSIDQTERMFKSKGIAVAQERWYEHAIRPSWFSELIPGVNLAMSNAIVEQMRGEGWLDENNVITSDSFTQNWYDTLARWNLTGKNWWGLDDAILDEVHVGYARHRTVSRNDDKVFEWFEGAYNLEGSGIASVGTQINQAKHET